MNILMVLTSHDTLGDTGHKTGFWLEEFAAPYYLFKDKGYTITLASPKGGQPPLDPKSDEADFQTASTERFKQDNESKTALANTQVLSTVDAADYDAVFYPGGHGPLWDLAEDRDSMALIESLLKQNKPVGLVCHASAALCQVKDSQGEYLVKGKRVTGFSNSEEDAVQLTNIVPFLVEDMLKENGADYQKGDDWASFAIADGNLITGQNPASSEAAAQLVIDQLAR